jgi:hypothetical protein
MRAGKNPPRFKVVGVRPNGKRIVISTHASLQIAKLVINLTTNCAGFSELHIVDRRQRRGRRRPPIEMR